MNKEALDSIELDESEDFAAMLADYDKKEEGSGDEKLVEGMVVQIGETQVLIDVGMKVEGRVYPNEIQDKDGNFLFKEGDKITVLVSGANTERPKVSYKKAIKKAQCKEYIEKNQNSEEDIDVTGVITGKNKGGFIVEVDGIDMFMPTSLATFKRDGKNPVGNTVTARVVKMDAETGSIVLSRRAYLNVFRKQKKEAIDALMANPEPQNGIVKSIKSYGMFVEVGGVEGLVHYTEISYKGPVNPASLYKEGDAVQVKAIDYDKEKKRLSLSIKQVLENPWEDIDEELEVGDTVKVVVTNMEKYGVFVDLGNEIEGFLHISEVSWNKNIKHPSEVLEMEQEIEVEVIELDAKEQRLRVSLKRLQAKPFENFLQKRKVNDKVTGKITSIKDFGAFVRVDEIEGLLHNEDVSWDKDETCKSKFKVGDEVEVVIIKIEAKTERVSFSAKRLTESPLDVYGKTHKMGDIVTGEVLDKKDFGIFVKLDEGIDGLIRLEDLGTKKPEEINVGDKIESVIVVMDSARNRIRLSVKKLARKQEREMLAQFNQDEDSGSAFEDAFKAIKK